MVFGIRRMKGEAVRPQPLLLSALLLALLLAYPAPASAMAPAGEAGTVSVGVADYSFTPQTVTAPQGSTVVWTFSGPSKHTATDSSGMGLFGSGIKAKGTSYSFQFVAAGSYAYRCTVHTSPTTAHAGNVLVPIQVTPTSGQSTTTFTITWSAAPMASGYVFDVQVKRPGTTSFTNWKTGLTSSLSATFIPDKGAGTYSFRSRVRKPSVGKASGWSPVRALSVTAASGSGKPRVPASGAYFGATTNHMAPEVPTAEQRRQMILMRESQIGRMYDIDVQFYAFEETWWTDPTNQVDWNLSNGRMPMISWGCPKYAGGLNGSAQINRGMHDSKIDAWAAAIRARKKPVFVRYCWEMITKPAQTGDPPTFHAAWQRIWNRFNVAVNGVRANDYVAWAFVTTAGGYDKEKAYYPGGAYVDWIGADGYNWVPCRGSTWRGFASIFRGWYSWAQGMGKPLVIPETGTSEDPDVAGRKAAWIKTMANDLKTSFPKIHAIVYFDTSGTRGCDWRVDTSAGALDAWRGMGQDSYFRPTR